MFYVSTIIKFLKSPNFVPRKKAWFEPIEQLQIILIPKLNTSGQSIYDELNRLKKENKMKNLIRNMWLVALMVGTLCLVPAVAFAATSAENTNTLDSTNPETREIDTMLVLSAFTFTSTERDAGEAVEDPSTDLIVSSNAVWKIQAKLTAVNTNYGVFIKKDGGSYTSALTTAYADISGASGTNADNLTIATTVKFDSVGWTDASFTNATAVLNIKILTSV